MLLSRLALLSLFALLVSSQSASVYFTSGSQSATRVCPFSNLTDYILSLKKGGTDILSTADYTQSYFLCQEYNYNCGYIENSTEAISIADGVQLDFTPAQLVSIIPSNVALQNQILPYLNADNGSGLCVLQRFPLILTDATTEQFFTGYMSYLASNIKTAYAAQKKVFAANWSNINVNIKTAVLETAKETPNFLNSNFFNQFLSNNYAGMSQGLKDTFTANNQVADLHSAYLIDSVTSTCNKYQSVNFLVDESGSIGSGPFQYAINFLSTYVTNTNDDVSIMSINFFDSTYDPWIGFGNNKNTILSKISAKTYRGQGTFTGTAINATVASMVAHGFPLGVPKILTILTDGGSYDDVVYASNYARSFGITLICVGIGANINNLQLLQIAGTQSNVININAFSSLNQLVSLIENFFCKQMINVQLNDFIPGNQVRVPSSPSYFRVEKGTNQTYQLEITYQVDPVISNQIIIESQYDPFPDQYSSYAGTIKFRPGILKKYYFISPVNVEEITVKKSLKANVTQKVSYLSIAGTNMNFNLSLKSCSTPTCDSEIAINKAVGSENYQNTADTASNSIYVPIAIGIAAVAAFSAAAIFAAQKLFNAGGIPQQAKPLETHQNIQQPNRDINEHASQISAHEPDRSPSRPPSRPGSRPGSSHSNKNGKK